MSDRTGEPNMDAEAHRQTYQAVMRFSSEFGVPFAMALTMFFVNLVLANHWTLALVAGLVTYFFVYFVVKAFFSH
ncbi:MAG: hypothetical protein GC152_13700 [Alphaproteobacteria bacterium]|nr:hypothetical protein [Alphaproteobacteria bacterium]